MAYQISKSSPLVLLILDGWGWGKTPLGNAILQAKTPVLDEIKKQFPFALLQASGLAVGMDWGESGNSEIGHLTIGAGRTIQQYSMRINQAIADDSFYSNQAFAGAFAHAIKYKSSIHIAGLLTSGSVHAHISHITALIELSSKIGGQRPVFLHLFLDGRDSGLQEGLELIEKLELELIKTTTAKIATVIGRDYAMDRNENWQATAKAYNLLSDGVGEKTTDIKQKIKNEYDSGQNDPSMPAIALDDYLGIQENDTLIFFNFREDSIRQIVKSFSEIANEDWFFSRRIIKNLYVATMTKYIESYTIHVAFPPPEVTNSLAEVVSINNMSQLHIAESEKYAHVTYFFNGITSREFDGETDIFIKSELSPRENPAMEVEKITDKVIEEIDRDFYEFIVVNFANGDMLAHEGNLETAVVGVQKVDEMVGRLKQKVLEKNGILVITADHGNVESMTYRGSGSQETKHNPNPVPFYLIGNDFKHDKNDSEIHSEESNITNIIADVAPTVLDLMGIEKPIEMTGQSLLIELLQ